MLQTPVPSFNCRGHRSEKMDQISVVFPSVPNRRDKGSPNLSLSCSGLEQALLFKVNLALAYSSYKKSYETPSSPGEYMVAPVAPHWAPG